jgi:DNA mismatch repair ATPase MutL
MAEIYATSDVARDIIQNAQYFTNPAKAIAEYVWNALDNGHPGQTTIKCQVIVTGRGKDGYIEVRDNASGMSKEELNNFFKMHAENIARKKGRRVRGMYGTRVH